METVGRGNTTGKGKQCRHSVEKKKKFLENGEELNMLVGEEGWQETRLETEFGMMLGKQRSGRHPVGEMPSSLMA